MIQSSSNDPVKRKGLILTLKSINVKKNDAQTEINLEYALEGEKPSS